MPTKTGKIVYSRPPSSPSKQAGRLVDAELWSKISPALAVRSVEIDLLEDEEVAQTVTVLDARTRRASLDTMGFELVPAVPLAADVSKTEAMAAALVLAKLRLPEALELIPFDITFRSSARDNRDSAKGPGGKASKLSSAVGRAHADFSPESAKLKIEQLVTNGTLPKCFLSRSRAILNVWHPLNTVRHAPLCFLDPGTQSLPSFSYALAYENKAGFNASIEAEPDHQWYYFDEMKPNEAVLFWNFHEDKSTDHDTLATGGSVFHAALDAHIPPIDPLETARHSVEVRIMVLF